MIYRLATGKPAAVAEDSEATEGETDLKIGNENVRRSKNARTI